MYSGGQQVFSPYDAMGNSPGMMIDPNNGEKTKYADPVTGDAIVDYGGMDAVTLRAYLASFRNGNFNGMYGLNTLLTEAGGGGGGTYQQARTLYFNVLAFFEEALNRNVISSYQLDFGGDDTGNVSKELVAYKIALKVLIIKSDKFILESRAG